MPGLDPGIHEGVPQVEPYGLCWLRLVMDCRVKPGNDVERWKAWPRRSELEFSLPDNQRRGADPRLAIKRQLHGQHQVLAVPQCVPRWHSRRGDRTQRITADAAFRGPACQR